MTSIPSSAQFPSSSPSPRVDPRQLSPTNSPSPRTSSPSDIQPVEQPAVDHAQQSFSHNSSASSAPVVEVESPPHPERLSVPAPSSTPEMPHEGDSLHSQSETAPDSVPMEASSSKAIDTGVNSDAPAEPWDPLQQNQAGPGSFRQPHDLAIVVEEDASSQDIVDANGRVLFTDEATRESPLGSRRASHLRLDLKPPSPQPWDLIDPPSDDGRKGGVDFCSTPGSRKFESMQNSSPARALIPKSSYYSGPPPSHSAYGTPPVGQIGRHHPREVLRIERDYTGGEVIQFAPIYPLELERRITPTQFLESINSINELLISAHSLRYSFLDNMLTVFTLQLSRHFLTSHYDKELARLRSLIDELNVGLYNPAGLHILWPGTVAFLFLEIEYY